LDRWFGIIQKNKYKILNKRKDRIQALAPAGVFSVAEFWEIVYNYCNNLGG
jgi:hypothetical protein